jgi:xanthine dehydrogenase YagS FAD-binding subunit
MFLRNAIAALDAVVEVRGSEGKRSIPLVDFHRLPGDTPQRDTNLAPGELITAVILPPSSFKSGVYLKLRDRASYSFALVSVATGLEVTGDKIKTARVALGGVAHKPWRAREAEEFLQGKTANKSTFESAAAIALQDAQPLAHSGLLALTSVVHLAQKHFLGLMAFYVLLLLEKLSVP